MAPSTFLATFALTLAVATLFGSRRNPAPAAPRWVPAVVAAVAIAHLLTDLDELGQLAAALALIGLLMPGLWLLYVRRLGARGEYGRAAAELQRFVRIRRSPALAGWVEVWEATEACVQGDPSAVDARIAAWEGDPARAAHREWLLGITWRWEAARAATSPDLRARALCELGEMDTAIALCAEALAGRRAAGAMARNRIEWLPVVAFAGRVSTTDVLCALLRLPLPLTAIWHATALAAAGQPDAARAALEVVGRRRDLTPGLRWSLALRQAHLPAPHPLGEPARTHVFRMEREILAGSVLRLRSPLGAPLTVGLLSALIGTFVLQHLHGGTMNPATAIELGALMPAHGFPKEPARLITYAFLHFGLLHLVVNGATIAWVGATVESAIGQWRLLLVYVGSAVGAGLGISYFGEAEITLGASGAAMGLLGALGVIAARDRRTRGTRTGRQIGLAIGALVLLQASLDASMPEISFVGHLSGAACGGLLAALLVRVRGSELHG